MIGGEKNPEEEEDEDDGEIEDDDEDPEAWSDIFKNYQSHYIIKLKIDAKNIFLFQKN